MLYSVLQNISKQTNTTTTKKVKLADFEDHRLTDHSSDLHCVTDHSSDLHCVTDHSSDLHCVTDHSSDLHCSDTRLPAPGATASQDLLPHSTSVRLLVRHRVLLVHTRSAHRETQCTDLVRYGTSSGTAPCNARIHTVCKQRKTM